MKKLPSWAIAGQYIALPSPSTDRAKILAVDPETGVTLIGLLDEGAPLAVRAKFIRRCFPVTENGEPNLPATPKLVSSHEAADNAHFDKLVLEQLDPITGKSVRALSDALKAPMTTTREALDRLHTAGKAKCFASRWVRAWTPVQAERPDYAAAAGWIRTVDTAPTRLSPLARALLTIVHSRPGFRVTQVHIGLLATTKLTPSLDDSHAELDRMERNGLLKTKDGTLKIEPKGDDLLLDLAGECGG